MEGNVSSEDKNFSIPGVPDDYDKHFLVYYGEDKTFAFLKRKGLCKLLNNKGIKYVKYIREKDPDGVFLFKSNIEEENNK